jgi:hypothetical protein
MTALQITTSPTFVKIKIISLWQCGFSDVQGKNILVKAVSSVLWI